MVVLLWLVLFSIFAGSYIIFFGYLKFYASKQWGLQIDLNFCPNVTILVPARNEEEMVQRKLKNLAEVSYPKEKIEIVLADDASTDQTLTEARRFIQDNPELSIVVLEQNPRKGKAEALNKGLEASSNDIIVATDADTFWPPDILRKAMQYMSDPTVGALTGRGVPESPKESWVTRAEDGYLSLINLVRLGESKIHSTIRFEGAFCVFKRSAFDKFDSESGADDSGTALQVVQNKFRAILVPEVCVFAPRIPYELWSRMKTKIRRATHLTALWLQCLKLLFKRRLVLPKRIAVPEMFISVLNPIIFVALAVVTFILVALHPTALIPLILGFCILGLIPKVRDYLITAVLDQFVLFYSIILYAKEKKIVAWEK